LQSLPLKVRAVAVPLNVDALMPSSWSNHALRLIEKIIDGEALFPGSVEPENVICDEKSIVVIPVSA
jgi:hypothetical protein